MRHYGAFLAGCRVMIITVDGLGGVVPDCSVGKPYEAGDAFSFEETLKLYVGLNGLVALLTGYLLFL